MKILWDKKHPVLAEPIGDVFISSEGVCLLQLCIISAVMLDRYVRQTRQS